MDKFIISTLPQLLLISKIPREGKLNVKNGELTIYQGGLRNWIMRNFNGDGREATIIFLKDFYINIQNNVREIIRHNAKEENTAAKAIASENLAAIIANLYSSLDGIKNLHQTYRVHIEIISNLEFIENHLIIPTIKSYIKSSEPVPTNEKFTKILEDARINNTEVKK
jgi:hypothetical protein